MLSNKKEILVKDIDNIQHIKIEDICATIEIENWENDYAAIYFNETCEEKYTIEKRLDKLYIIKKVDSHTYKIKHKNCRLILKIPNKKYNLALNVVSSDIQTHIKQLNRLKVNSVSGNTHINVLKCDTMLINSVSGDIVLNQIESNYIKLDTVSANADIRITDKKENFNINIMKVLSNSVIDNQADKTLHINTVTGNNQVKFLL